MNSTLKNGIIILVLAVIFLIFAYFIFPSLLVLSIFSGNFGSSMLYSSLIFIFILLGIIFLIIGPILILLGFIKEPRNVIVTKNQQPANFERRCPNCGRVIPNDAVICPFCKNDFEEKNMSEKKEGFCPGCGVKIDGVPVYCFKCGYKMR